MGCKKIKDLSVSSKFTIQERMVVAGVWGGGVGTSELYIG